MYLFSRTRQARPDRMLDAMPAAVGIAAKVTQITGVPIHVWSFRFGQPVGTTMWSCRLDSQAQLFDLTEKLTADAGYLDSVAALGELFEGPTSDSLLRLVSGTPSPQPTKYIEVTQATMANGKYAEAIQFGVDMQEFIAADFGAPTMFGTAQHGGFADVGWVMGLDSVETIDRAADWEMTNAEYHAKVNAGAGLFVEGSGQQALLEKLN